MIPMSGQFVSAHVLERIRFSFGDCAFVDRHKYLALTVSERFDIRSFAKTIETTTKTLRERCKKLLECGYYVERELFGTGGIGNLPQEMLSDAHGDGHNPPKTKRTKEAEDENFRYVFTWLEGGDQDKGWTTPTSSNTHRWVGSSRYSFHTEQRRNGDGLQRSIHDARSR